MTTIQKVKSGLRVNWKVGQLIGFQHGPDRLNIYRFRVTEIGEDGKPSQTKLVGGRPWKNKT